MISSVFKIKETSKIAVTIDKENLKDGFHDINDAHQYAINYLGSHPNCKEALITLLVRIQRK